MNPRILVAGIGNVFLGDDAFGVEVVRRLADKRLPEGVRVQDFGIRSFDLANTLLEGYDAAILVDALSRGKEPGTLYVLEPDLDSAVDTPVLPGHDLDPSQVFRLARTLGGQLPKVRILGCEPASLEPGLMELSAPVRSALAPALGMLEALVQDYLASLRPSSPLPLSPSGERGRGEEVEGS
jgi:hydrogenase maturation protease